MVESDPSDAETASVTITGGGSGVGEGVGNVVGIGVGVGEGVGVGCGVGCIASHGAHGPPQSMPVSSWF